MIDELGLYAKAESTIGAIEEQETQNRKLAMENGDLESDECKEKKALSDWAGNGA